MRSAMVLLSHYWLELFHWTTMMGHEGRFVSISVADLHTLAHFCVLMQLTATIVALRAHLLLLGLWDVLGMLQIVCFIYVESQVFLKLLNLSFRGLTGLEILLSLSLKSSVRFHKIIVEFDQLLHLLECITSHFCLISHLMLNGLLLSVLVPSHECLILASQKHNSLLVFHLCFDLLFT